jgi:Fe-S-cluster containining protein
MIPSDVNSPWYRDGLKFTCTRCGACCTGAPGYVWVVAEEIDRLAAFLGMPVDEFTRAYVRQVGDRFSLIERPGGDCIFWAARAGCTVYPARPVQCQTWPFWPENLTTRRAWNQATRICPGSDATDGRVFSVEEIRSTAARVGP